MPQPVTLGPQVHRVRQRWWRRQRINRPHVDAELLQSVDFARVVGEQPHRTDAEVGEDGGRRRVLPVVDGQSEGGLGVDSVQTCVLQRVRAELVEQPDAATFVTAQVEDHPARRRHPGHREGQLRSAVAALRAQHIAGQTLRMQPDRRHTGWQAERADQREVFGPGEEVAVAHQREHAVLGGEGRLDHPGDPVVHRAPGHEFLDREHRQVVLLGEGQDVGAAHHRAVVADEFGDGGDRLQAGQPAQVDRRLGMPGPFEHATRPGSQRNHVPGSDQVARSAVRPGQRTDGAGAIGGADARGDADPGVNGDRVRRPQWIGVDRHHQRQLQFVGALLGHGRADEARAVPDGPGHPLGRERLAGEDDVAFVLPVGGIGHQHRQARPQRGERTGDGRRPARPGHDTPPALAPTGTCSRRSTYFAITSTSRLTGSPGCL